MLSSWQRVGEFGVDAGLCIIGDPCYFAVPDASSHPAKTWEEFCDMLFGSDFDKNNVKQLDYRPGSPGLGVVVSTGYGDGCYPVYVKKNQEGRVMRVLIKFD